MFRFSRGRPCASRRWVRPPAGVVWQETIKRMGPIAFYHGANATYDESDLVSSWTDLSGNGRHATQSTADDKPTLDTSEADAFLLFDNDDATNGKFLACNAVGTALSGLAAATIFIAYRHIDASNGVMFSGDGSDIAYMHITSASTRVYIGAGTNYIEYAAATQDSDYVEVMVYDGSQATNAAKVRIWRDGTELTSTADSGTIATSIPTLTATGIGRGTAVTNPFDGRIYTLGVVGRALSTADRLTLENALHQGLAFY